MGAASERASGRVSAMSVVLQCRCTIALHFLIYDIDHHPARITFALTSLIHVAIGWYILTLSPNHPVKKEHGTWLGKSVSGKQSK